MMKKNLFFVLVILGLTACTSSILPIRYYSLNLNGVQDVENMRPANRIRVLIEPVQLVKFLDQDNMIMQIGENEIYKASFHRWAEPLDQAIIKLLVHKLNNKNKTTYQFAKTDGVKSQNSDLYLRLEIDQFHSTDNAQVVLSGHYRLYNKDQSLEMMKYFNISDQLTGNGYAYSVEKLKDLLAQLAEHILGAMEAQNLKHKVE